MALTNWNNCEVQVNGKPVETTLIKYKIPKTGNHVEYYNLSKRYEKFLTKLLRLTNKDKITNNIDEFITLAHETKRIMSDNYVDAHLYFKSIDDMIETLTTYKQKHI